MIFQKLAKNDHFRPKSRSKKSEKTGFFAKNRFPVQLGLKMNGRNLDTGETTPFLPPKKSKKAINCKFLTKKSY